MTLALTIGSVVLVLLGLIMGAWRGTRLSLLALTATLLGFIVSSYWGDAWATQLSEQYSFDARAFSFALSTALLLGPALIIGYAGANLLTKATVLKPVQRLAGAMLGILNGVVQAGFLLRYASNLYPDLLKELKTLPVMGWLHEGPPIIALTVATIGVLAVVIQALVQTLKSRSASPQVAAAQANATVRLPSSAPSTPSSASPVSAEQRQANQASALEKVNKALDQR